MKMINSKLSLKIGQDRTLLDVAACVMSRHDSHHQLGSRPISCGPACEPEQVTRLTLIA